MFSVGFNFEENFLVEMKEYVDKLSSIYFPIPFEYMGSGRSMNEPSTYKEDILLIIKFCKEFGLKSLMLLNATLASTDMSHMKKVVDYVVATGVDGVVCVNPAYMKIFKSAGLEVQASVNCYIDSVEKAEEFAKYCDVVTVDRDINRNVELVRKINSIVPVKVMVNEGCLFKCPYRTAHYDMLSLGEPLKNCMKADKFIQNACVSEYKKEPWRVLCVPFVRPEDLFRYDFISEFKLSTRVMSTDLIVKVLRAYSSKMYIGNLVDLLDTHGMKTIVKSIDNHLIPSEYFEKYSDDEYCKELFSKIGEKY